VVVLLVLIGLAARLDAGVGVPQDAGSNNEPGNEPGDEPGDEPSDDLIAVAVRYADILTGASPDHVRDGPGNGPDDDDDDPDDDPDDPEVDDSAAQRADLDPAELAWSDGGYARVQPDGDERDDGAIAARGAAIRELALQDVEQTRADATDDNLRGAASSSDAETHEAWLRLRRSSRWGRLDVGFAWRHQRSEPRFAPPRRTDEVWLFATWRR